MNTLKRRKIKRSTDLRLLFFTFLGAFIIFFAAFTFFLPVLTPKVEIPALSEEHVIDSITSHDFKGRIDPRLHSIELQEQLTPIKLKPEQIKEKIEERKVPLPAAGPVDSISNEDNWINQKNKETIVQHEEIVEQKIQKSLPKVDSAPKEEVAISIPPRPRPLVMKEKIDLVPPVPVFRSKVIIGDFSNPKEAKIASDILLSLNFEPFIRLRNGKYILQVASFSDQKKAEALVSELKNRNFDAKIIYE